MKIEQSAKLRQHPDYSALVERKSALLNGVPDLATAEGTWDLATDPRGRPLLRLRMTDSFNGQCSGDFAPEEMQNETHFTSRLANLKGALLHVGQWRSQLQQLFRNIRQWSEHLPGGAYVAEDPIILREERSGDYEVSRLLITSNGHTMRVEPVASWVVGADGRVDLKGAGGPLILLYSRNEGGWFYFQNSSPAAMTPLTEPLFLQLAEMCLHG